MNGKKILIIDDEPEFVEMLKMRLEKSGYNVVTAGNTDEAMDIIKCGPDLVLLDIMMPRVDGYTLYRQLKKDDATKSIPVIVVTAKPEMKELFQAEGVTDYLVKPIDDEELMATIEKTLG